MTRLWLAATIFTAVALLEAWRRLRDQLPAEARHRLGLLDELEAVPGVGPNRARAIRERLR